MFDVRNCDAQHDPGMLLGHFVEYMALGLIETRFGKLLETGRWARVIDQQLAARLGVGPAHDETEPVDDVDVEATGEAADDLPDVIGGVYVQLGDQVLDGTVRTNLDLLAKDLGKARVH